MSAPIKKLGYYTSLAYTFPVSVLILTGLGWLVDKKSGLFPLFTLAGFVLGLIAAFTHLIKTLNRLEKKK